MVAAVEVKRSEGKGEVVGVADGWRSHITWNFTLHILDLLHLCRSALLIGEANPFLGLGVQTQFPDGLGCVGQVGFPPSRAIFYGQVAQIRGNVRHYPPAPTFPGHGVVYGWRIP